MKTDCEGCKERHYTFRNLTNLNDGLVRYVICSPLPQDEICPCSICIVKMICNIKCKKVYKYRGGTYREK
jgi:hypothetical protein